MPHLWNPPDRLCTPTKTDSVNHWKVIQNTLQIMKQFRLLQLEPIFLLLHFLINKDAEPKCKRKNWTSDSMWHWKWRFLQNKYLPKAIHSLTWVHSREIYRWNPPLSNHVALVVGNCAHWWTLPSWARYATEPKSLHATTYMSVGHVFIDWRHEILQITENLTIITLDNITVSWVRGSGEISAKWSG